MHRKCDWAPIRWRDWSMVGGERGPKVGGGEGSLVVCRLYSRTILGGARAGWGCSRGLRNRGTYRYRGVRREGVEDGVREPSYIEVWRGGWGIGQSAWLPVLIKNYTRKKYRRHPSHPLAPAPTPERCSLFLSLARPVVTLFPACGTLFFSLPLGPPNSSTARQASQTSGIHYSCRPTPLDGGTLKIVRKQIRPAPPTPFTAATSPPPMVSTRRRASYAIARNDARLIGTARFFPSFVPDTKSLITSVCSDVGGRKSRPQVLNRFNESVRIFE